MVKKAKVAKKITKKTLLSTVVPEVSYDDVLLSRWGEAEGVIDVKPKETVFCFYPGHNPMISLETMDKWVKQAERLEKAIKNKKIPVKKQATKTVLKTKKTKKKKVK